MLTIGYVTMAIVLGLMMVGCILEADPKPTKRNSFDIEREIDYYIEQKEKYGKHDERGFFQRQINKLENELAEMQA